MSKNKKNTKVEQKKSTKTFSEEETPKQKIDNPNVKILKDIFSNWTDEDLLSALNDYNGDINLTISRISEGHATQWSTFKKNEKAKKEKETQPKPSSSEEKPNRNFSNGPKFGEGEKPRNEKFQGNQQGGQGKPKFDRKPREDVRKKDVVTATTDWASAPSWESQTTPSTQTIVATPTPVSQPTATSSSIAPWADKSKINQPVAVAVEPVQIAPKEPESVYATTVYFPPQSQPQQSQQSIHVQPSQPVQKVPEKTVQQHINEVPKSQEISRIPAPAPVSKPIPQPQLPPPMTNPNSFKAISRQSPQEKSIDQPIQSNPIQGGLRFGTTGLAGEELPPIEASQRSIKKEEPIKPQGGEQYQNPPGFGVPIGFQDASGWQQRGLFQQPTVAEQAFKPQEGQPQNQPMGGYPLYGFPFPFYPGMYPAAGKVMYKQPQPYYMAPSGGVPSASVPSGRPVAQPGMPYETPDFKPYGYSTGRPSQAPGQDFKPQQPQQPQQPMQQPQQPQQPQFYPYGLGQVQGQNYQGNLWS